jgi:hypothetical protein
VAIGQAVQAMGGVEPQRPGHRPPGPGVDVRPGINHRNVVNQLGERQVGARELVAEVVAQQLGVSSRGAGRPGSRSSRCRWSTRSNTSLAGPNAPKSQTIPTRSGGPVSSTRTSQLCPHQPSPLAVGTRWESDTSHLLRIVIAPPQRQLVGGVLAVAYVLTILLANYAITH